MATIKSYTSLEQSKKLTKILSLESADMYYMETSYNDYTIGVLQRMERDMLLKQAEYYKMFACWSLTALFNVLPGGYVIVKNYHGFYYVESRDHSKYTNIFDNPVDACVNMIEMLHKMNLL